MSRVHKHTSKAIDGRRCDCHGTRRAGGVNAALSEREKDGALRAPSFYILSRRICATHASIAFLRVVPSRCEWLHGGHPSRPLHEQHRVACGREEETRWSRDETGCTDHESMISCNLEQPTKPPRHCRKSTTLANRVPPERFPFLTPLHPLAAGTVWSARYSSAFRQSSLRK